MGILVILCSGATVLVLLMQSAAVRSVSGPWRDSPRRAEYPLRHQDPVQSISPLVSKQLSRSWDAGVGVVVDARNPECHTMQADQVLVSDGRDGKHSDLCIVHALIVSNLDDDDVDVIVLHPSDESYDYGEEPVVVTCLVCEVPPILWIP